jgi:hypothetical protein
MSFEHFLLPFGSFATFCVLDTVLLLFFLLPFGSFYDFKRVIEQKLEECEFWLSTPFWEFQKRYKKDFYFLDLFASFYSLLGVS